MFFFSWCHRTVLKKTLWRGLKTGFQDDKHLMDCMKREAVLSEIIRDYQSVDVTAWLCLCSALTLGSPTDSMARSHCTVLSVCLKCSPLFWGHNEEEKMTELSFSKRKIKGRSGIMSGKLQSPLDARPELQKSCFKRQPELIPTKNTCQWRKIRAVGIQCWYRFDIKKRVADVIGKSPI